MAVIGIQLFHLLVAVYIATILQLSETFATSQQDGIESISGFDKNIRSNKNEIPSSSQLQENNWKLVSESSSGSKVRTYMKPFPGTKLVAFKGVALLDVHISRAMGLFCDFNMSYEWVDMLDSIKAYPLLNKQQPNLQSKSLKCQSKPFQITDGNGNTTNTYSTTESEFCIDDITTLESTITNKNIDHNFMDCRPHGQSDLVHQTLKLPWPIASREILLRRDWEYTSPITKTLGNSDISRESREENSTFASLSSSSSSINLKNDDNLLLGDESSTSDSTYVTMGCSVTVRYHSVEDDRIPLKDGSKGVNKQSGGNINKNGNNNGNGKIIVRAISPHTLWKFEAVSLNTSKSNSTSNKGEDKNYKTTEEDDCSIRKSTHTRVLVEVIVDSRGSIPQWLINYVQRSWPDTALNAFNRLVKQGDDEEHSSSNTGKEASSSVLSMFSSKGKNRNNKGGKKLRVFEPVVDW